jgi:hypothetical protein
LKQLADLSKASAAVKLFAQWCELCTEDAAWRGRFKVTSHFCAFFSLLNLEYAQGILFDGVNMLQQKSFFPNVINKLFASSCTGD